MYAQAWKRPVVFMMGKGRAFAVDREPGVALLLVWAGRRCSTGARRGASSATGVTPAATCFVERMHV